MWHGEKFSEVLGRVCRRVGVLHVLGPGGVLRSGIFAFKLVAQNLPQYHSLCLPFFAVYSASHSPWCSSILVLAPFFLVPVLCSFALFRCVGGPRIGLKLFADRLGLVQDIWTNSSDSPTDLI